MPDSPATARISRSSSAEAAEDLGRQLAGLRAAATRRSRGRRQARLGAARARRASRRPSRALRRPSATPRHAQRARDPGQEPAGAPRARPPAKTTRKISGPGCRRRRRSRSRLGRDATATTTSSRSAQLAVRDCEPPAEPRAAEPSRSSRRAVELARRAHRARRREAGRQLEDHPVARPGPQAWKDAARGMPPVRQRPAPPLFAPDLIRRDQAVVFVAPLVEHADFLARRRGRRELVRERLEAQGRLLDPHGLDRRGQAAHDARHSCAPAGPRPPSGVCATPSPGQDGTRRGACGRAACLRSRDRLRSIFSNAVARPRSGSPRLLLACSAVACWRCTSAPNRCFSATG